MEHSSNNNGNEKYNDIVKRKYVENIWQNVQYTLECYRQHFFFAQW